MTEYREILRLSNMGLSRTSIGASLGYSRNTVADVVNRAQLKSVEWPLPLDVTDCDLQALLYPEKVHSSSRKLPDSEKLHKEMAKSGVTLTLLWDEYCGECKQNGQIPFAYTQFCHYYHKYVQTTKATMHIHRKPGEQIEVDWAGKTANIIDNITGDAIPVYVFVAVLSCSGYAYVEAFLSQKQESWISAHVNAFRYFGGVTRIIVPDNLKTGVEKVDWYSPTINKSYHEMAEHYATAIVPARVYRPKDKPKVEGTVGVISTWIIAALRNDKYFSLTDLNEAISQKLREFNEKPFQKKLGSRYTAFVLEEKEFLLPLPKNRYELALWKKLIPGFNYHISLEKNFYSVPYEYIKHEMDVRITRTVVEIFYHNHRICSHPRIYGKPGQYHTTPEHMPEKHKSHTEWNSGRFVSWGNSIGMYTGTVVKAILTSHKIEQQAYRSCMGLLKLGDRHGVKRLEAACEKALSYTPNPSYKHVDSILKSGQDTLISPAEIPHRMDESHSFTRGADYYGRKK